mgnify:FL=1
MSKRRFLILLMTALTFNLFMATTAWAQSGVYAGGPVYLNRAASINELKNSGFTYVVVWTIHIDQNGNFNFNGEFPLVSNGSYIGGSTHPNFAGDIAALKQGSTTINRVEFSLSAWGSGTFDNIRNLVNAQGTGPTSILYRNFQALRNAIPAIDAINFDDESTYDVNTATPFAVMLADLGYKVTLVPYTNQSFWTTLANNVNSQRPGTIDRVDLQVYAGGGGNNPCNWNFGSIRVHPGLWSNERSPTDVQNQLNTWNNQCANVQGGFMWLYDDFDNSSLVNQYATAINNVFGIDPTAPVTLYQHCSYGGYSASFQPGSYTLADLQTRGVANDDISSLRVGSGYQVTLYQHHNFTGNILTILGDDDCLVNEGYNDDISSIVISSIGGGFNVRTEAESYFASSGVALEATQDVDGNQNVGWIDSSDWMAYNSLTVPTTGTYTIEYRVASPNGGQLTLDLNGGSIVLGTKDIPVTGGWQNWTTISQTVHINAGTYNFGIYANTGGWNINWWRIRR